MKKSYFMLALLAGVSLLTTSVQAQDKGLYVGLKTSMFFSPSSQNNLEIQGLGILHQKFKTGFALNAAVGYDWGKYLRSEFELGYKFQGAKNLNFLGASAETNGTVRQFTLMPNLYVDIPLSDNFEFFVGGGLGLSIIGAKNYHLEGQDPKIIKGKNSAFAYQFMTGVSYGLTTNVDLTFEYRYYQTVPAKVKNDGGVKIKADFNAHQIGFGIRYTF